MSRVRRMIMVLSKLKLIQVSNAKLLGYLGKFIAFVNSTSKQKVISNMHFSVHLRTIKQVTAFSLILFFRTPTSFPNVTHGRNLKCLYRQYRRKISQAPQALLPLGRLQAPDNKSNPSPEREVLPGGEGPIGFELKVFDPPRPPTGLRSDMICGKTS